MFRAGVPYVLAFLALALTAASAEPCRGKADVQGQPPAGAMQPEKAAFRQADRPGLPPAVVQPRAGQPMARWREPAPGLWLAPLAAPPAQRRILSPDIVAACRGPSNLRLHVLLCTWLT
jgi:hypothetical protein